MSTDPVEIQDERPKRVSARFIQDSKPRKRGFVVFRMIVLSFVLVPLLVVGGFVIWVISNLPPMAVIENPSTDLSTQIYSADGVLLRSLFHEKNRVSVNAADISPHVFNALVSIEDERFYDHSGIDPVAPFAIIKGSLQGKDIRGGSTITMQLARNLYDQVGRERSLLRKLKEVTVAVVLEGSFTKEEIITAYLNTVSFVGNTYGIENGAKSFFGKSANELAIEEAALLVGLLKATDAYNPRRHPEKALKRRNEILNKMYEFGFGDKGISLDSAKKIPIALVQNQDYRDLGLAPYFTEHLRRWFKGWCEEHGYDPYTDGLRVYTTIDSRMQRHAEAAVAEHLSELQVTFNKQIEGREPYRKDTTFFLRAMRKSQRYASARLDGLTEAEIIEEFKQPIKMDLFSWKGEVKDTLMSPWDSLRYYAPFLETGFMAIEPTNGEIKAWVGGINHKFFKYDHVYDGKRQVGSTFKPFVYTAAMDNGFTPCDVELNQPIFFYDDTGKMIWAPKNADGKVGGYMTLRTGLGTSTNLITARVMKAIGPHVVCEWARKMGITSNLDCVPSLCLGTTDLSVFELVSAYCTFANKGVYNEPIFVSRIEDRNGNIIQTFTSQGREAISERTAYMMIDMLKGVVDGRGGTAGRLRGRYKLKGEIGGKTGTTQNNSDGWFVGVTSNMVAGAWTGCADRTMRFSSTAYGQGASMALPIYGLFMSKVYADSTISLPIERFKVPQGFDVELDCAKYTAQRGGSFTDSLTPKFNSVLNVDDE
jgi:penicillin-binding protein 1A